MNITGLNRQQIITLVMVFLMIGSSVVYVLAYAFG
jgi:hypothetical protein